MFGTQNLVLFVVSGFLLNLTPGQDTLYIVGRSIAQGRRAGVLSVLGITSGCVVHTLAAAFGLSAILATSARAFLVVKWVGAAYLAYLGVRMIVDRSENSGGLREFGRESAWRIYRAGFFTNLLNPKVALFFMAFCRSSSIRCRSRRSRRSCFSARCSCSPAPCGVWRWPGPRRP